MGKKILTLFFITILAGISVGIIVFNLDPYKSGGEIIFLFLSSLFAFIWGLGSLVLFSLNLSGRNRWQDSFRRGLLLALFFIALILFRINDIFYWYMVSGFGGALVVTEALLYKSIRKNDDA